MRQIPFVLYSFILLFAAVALHATCDETSDEAPWKRLLTGEDADRVAKLEGQILEFYEKGRYSDACDPARSALEIREKLQGMTHWQARNARNTFVTLTKISSLPQDAQDALTEATKSEKQELPRLQREARYRDAIAVAERVVEVRQRHLGADPNVATALNSQATFCYRAGKYEQAETLYRKALEISKKVNGDIHPSTAAVYGNLAISLESQDKYAEARAAKEKALEILLHVHGEDSEAVAIAYNNLAHHLETQGQYGEAETRYRKALEILQRGQGEASEKKTATAHNNLGSVLNQQAKHAEAEREYHRALEIQRRWFGDDHPEMATVYNNLGVCLIDQGKYADAEALHRKALEIHVRILGEDHLLTLQSYSNLAVTLGHQSRYLEGELLLRRAIHLQSAATEQSNRSTAVWHVNLAHNLQAQGRNAEAKGSLERALALFQRILGKEHPDTALTAIDLAVALNEQEKYDEAEPLFSAAVESLRQRLGERHPLTAQAQANLAGNNYYRGQYATAESLHKEALEVFQQVLGSSHPTTTWVYRNLMLDLWVQGKYAEAEKLGVAAAESFESARRQVSFAGLDRTTFAAEYSPLPLLTALAARDGKAAAAWQHLESDLARGLLDDLSTRPWTETEREHERRLSLQIDEIDTRVSALLSTPKVAEPNRQKAEELARRRAQLQKEFSELHADLSHKYGAAGGEVFDLARIQKQIPVDSAFVAWIDFAGWPKGHDPNGEHWGCVLRRTGNPQWVRLPGSGTEGAWTSGDDQLAGQLRGELASRPTTAVSEAAEVRKLYTQRLAPLEKHLEAGASLPAVRHLIILPSQKMRGIPVDVLTEEVHPGRYTVSYAPSGTLFASLREKRAGAKPSPQTIQTSRLLAVGDPVLGPASPAADLPVPPEQGILIAAVTPGSNAAKSGLRGGDVLLRYSQMKLAAADDLETAIGKTTAQATGGRKAIPVQFWREGETLDRDVEPGPLGIVPSKAPAGQAIRSQRELDQLMRRSSQSEFGRLKGAERELQAVSGVFRTATVLKGSEASEQNLRKLAAEGRLGQFHYIHFATHGLLDSKSPMHSALILSRELANDPLSQTLAGKPAFNGRLTAEQILRGWKLDAELVTLSACETGLGKYAGGEGYLGFSQALFLSGAKSLMLSLWKVDDASTTLLMTRFYENLMGSRPNQKDPMSKAQALAEAKTWLRNLKAEEADQVSGGLIRGLDTDTARGNKRSVPAKQSDAPAASNPYAHPYYWAPFILVGDLD